MATCPHCGGHLTSGHRCRGRTRRLMVVGAFAIGGGVAALIVVALVDPGGAAARYDALAFAAGAAAGAVAARAISRRRAR